MPSHRRWQRPMRRRPASVIVCDWGTAVQSIDADGWHDRALTDRRGPSPPETIVAALPLPVLSRIWPMMPLELGAIGYGVGGKISVQFDRRIWRDYGSDGEVLTERAWGHLWETTDDQGGDRGVLTEPPFVARRRGVRRASEGPDRIVAEIDRIFPGRKVWRVNGCTPIGRTTRARWARTAASAPARSPRRSRRARTAMDDCCWPESTPTISADSWRVPSAAVGVASTITA